MFNFSGKFKSFMPSTDIIPFLYFYQWFSCPLIKRQCKREYFSFSRASWLILWSHMWSLWTEVHTKSNFQHTCSWRAKNRICKTHSWRENPSNALWVSAEIHNLIKHAARTSARASAFCISRKEKNSVYLSWKQLPQVLLTVFI